jgi:hypothetical protein
MNKNNQLHDAHVKAYQQKESDEAHKSMDKVLTKTISKIENVEKKIKKISEDEYQQTTGDLNEVQIDFLMGIWNDAECAIWHMDIEASAFVWSMPNYLLRYIHEELTERIEEDKKAGKYEYGTTEK